MSEIHPARLAALPLLLWKTPPGLELILAQEGMGFEAVREAHPFAFRGARFVLFDGRRESPASMRLLLTAGQVAIDVDAYRKGEPFDPFDALVDDRPMRAAWQVDGLTLRERVARRPKATIRERIIGRLREDVLTHGGVWARLAPFPHPFRSAFNLRVDMDEPVAEDYFRFAQARGPLDDCTTHFVSTAAYQAEREVLADLAGRDAQSHGHYHYVYRDPEANLRNLERADLILRDRGIEVEGFAGPHGRWNASVDDAMEALGYSYSSDFQLGYDDLPFFPWKDGRFSRVLQVPVHPICEGLFLDAGATGGRCVADHLAAVVAEKADAGEPAFVYGHPERRLGRMPEVMAALTSALGRRPLVWRTTLTEMARWWRWRASRKWLAIPRGPGRLEVQFEDWDAGYRPALEVFRGEFRALLPLSGPRTLVDLGSLAFERRPVPARRAVRQPEPDRRPASWRQMVRQAIDWETVTPVDEIPVATIAGRVKKGLRRWKLQKTGTN
jgi:peptidoglycan/xylan/chitin deacetylase (PgdA/CDA1 family)